MKATRNKKHSVWQHISVVTLICMLFNAAILYATFIAEYIKAGSTDSLYDTFLGDFIDGFCFNYRFMITDVFLMDYEVTEQIAQRHFVIEIVVVVVCLLLIFLATRLYKTHAKPIATVFIVLVSVNMLFSFLLLFVPHVLILTAVHILLIVALSLTIVHTNKTKEQLKQ